MISFFGSFFFFVLHYIDSRLEEYGEALDRNREKRRCYHHFYTLKKKKKKKRRKIVHGLFRKRSSRIDNLTLSFLFLQGYHASYCFNLVFKIYFTHSSSILPVTSFYGYAISYQEICCCWEHCQGIM